MGRPGKGQECILLVTGEEEWDETETWVRKGLVEATPLSGLSAYLISSVGTVS